MSFECLALNTFLCTFSRTGRGTFLSIPTDGRNDRFRPTTSLQGIRPPRRQRFSRAGSAGQAGFRESYGYLRNRSRTASSRSLSGRQGFFPLLWPALPGRRLRLSPRRFFTRTTVSSRSQLSLSPLAGRRSPVYGSPVIG